MVTIKDIARQAGVSTATVSYVLNGLEHKVAAETRKKILKIIKDMNYRPNLIARGLKQTRTNMIGVMLIDVINPFFSEIIKGIHDTCRAENYNFILSYSEDDPTCELQSLYTLVERQVDGILITPVVIHETDRNRATILRERQQCHDEIRRRGIPMVAMTNKFLETGCDSIVHDTYGGGVQAARHLIQLGHRRIAQICVLPLPVDPDPRFRGFTDTLAQHDIHVDPNLTILSMIGIEESYLAVKEFLKKRTKFTAMFVFNDHMAIGAYRALREAGLRIPEDVALVGFDNIHESAYLDVALSTVNLPKYELGSMAVDLLLKQIKNGLRTIPTNMILETRLIVRESSGGALA